MTPVELDCRGLACPEPVVQSKNLIESTHPAALMVLVDNMPANENVSRFLTRNGYTVTSHHADGLWRISGSCNAPLKVGAEQKESTAPRDIEARTLVLLTTETLGRGNDDLGSKLMGNFIGSLGELGTALWRIVLLNGGVKLSALPGKSLDELKKLEKAGVGILVCGTCLDFYHLLDQKEVGETTNMMDVVTSLALADKVIRP